jgi:guanyl-specific ribonuclease Sa
MRSLSATLRKAFVTALLLVFGVFLPGWAASAAPVQDSPAQATVIPAEARRTLAYIRAHDAAPPGYVGGRRFGNYERVLPARDAQGRAIEYREWDIQPKVPGRNRGAQRLVTGSDGRAWYTADHYATFTEIREP